MRPSNNHRHNGRGKIRYAVVGLGHIAQNAVLPAFRHAGKNSELAALVSDDPTKLREMSRLYGAEYCFDYDQYDDCLRSGHIDAVYIALPNKMHEEYCVRAAEEGIHVLCEKPLAPMARECCNIIEACAENGVKLMTAYRLHFERANLEAVEIIRSGKIGEPRIFNSVFSQQVNPGNIRTRPDGAPLYDIGIYCINAARYLFEAEPTEALALCATGDDPRFKKIEEMASAILRFPDEQLASFTVSFGAVDNANFEVLGTKGKLRAVQGYEYTAPITLEITIDGRSQTRQYAQRDQFAPELLYFSDCILKNRQPEPAGEEGLRDVHIIECLYKSAEHGEPVEIEPLPRRRYPTLRQEIHRPRNRKPRLVNVEAPSA